jgi:hypothetical protein
MKTLDQLKQSVICENLTASDFRSLLKSNQVTFYEGFKGGDFIFYLINQPKTIFLFSDIDGFSLGIVTYQ